MPSDLPEMIGSMFVEVNEDGHHGVVEIAMIQYPDGHVEPGGVRDAVTREQPVRVPSLPAVREAMEIAKWCYLNQDVFEGRVSNSTKWHVATDTCINDVLREDTDPELN